MSNSKSQSNAHDNAALKAEQWSAVQAASAQSDSDHQDDHQNVKAQTANTHGAKAHTEVAKSVASEANDPQSIERVVTVEIPPQTEFVRVARLAATGVASRMRFTYDQIEDIKLAISEACNNAILHAQPAASAENSTPSSIIVRFWPYDDRLEISVADGGHLPPPGLPLQNFATHGGDDEALMTENLPESGMGLMLIQALMDEVSQPESAENAATSTTLHMTKRLRPL